WWQESHESVLARVRGTEWPSDRPGVETLAGEIAGDELHARMSTPVRIGLQPSRWLDALAGAAQDALIMDIATDGGDWPRLWAFLCGLDEETRLEFAATQLAKRGLTADVPPGYQPTGEFLLARDAYGTRFLLAASFFIPNGPAPSPAPHHWYAWDLDWCSMGAVMAAGPCPSPAEALAEWRTAVGPAATAAGLSPCPPDLAMRLLHPALALGTIWETVHGSEPRELMREYFRLSHRAYLLAEYLADNFPQTIEDEHPGDEEEDAEEQATENTTQSFLNWHAERTPSASDKSRNLTALALDTLIDAWTPFLSPDKAMFCACSPHRIEDTGIVLRDDYDPDDANAALELLPEWVQWCAERSGLDSESTARSLEAARAQAAIVVDDNYAPAPDRDPFARQE
ncbi:MAG: hypothetical protein JWM19_1293, partial [Actinomycetia bacterium]|nr:hypothetical protein [Actinomycetes bacterium]